MAKRGDRIRKRIDGRWEGRYPCGANDAGHVVYRSVYGHTYGEVKRKLSDAAQSQYTKGRSRRTLADVAALWLEHNRIHLKKSSQDKYETMFRNHIIPMLGSKGIGDITATDINVFLAEKMENGRRDGGGGLTSSYVRTMMVLLQSVMQFAAQEGWCPPLRSAIEKPLGEKAEIRPFTRDERAKLERYLQGREDLTALGVLLSLYTGLRIGEVCALQWGNIDLKGGLLSVTQTTVRVKEQGRCCWRLESPKTSASVRRIPLTPKMIALLHRYYDTRISPFIISQTDTFVNPRTYDYRYHRLLQDCGLPALKYHTLRHTFASCAIECGMDVKTLSEILGHADTAITLRTYVHTSMEQKRAQMEKLKYLSA